MPIAYDYPVYRPPSEGDNLIIQATLGCSFNHCSFCSMYRSKDYHARPLEQVLADIDAAARAWPGCHRVFLADGDALTLPAEMLEAILDHLAARLPALQRVTCYATPINLLKKTPQELERLRAKRLTMVYLGVESGSDLILRKITKGNRRQTGEALMKARDAGIKTSATVILGLGGQAHWQEHADQTAELVSRCPPNYLSTLQLYLEPAQRAEFLQKFGEDFQPLDDEGVLLEQRRLLAAIDPVHPIIFRSNHASNCLPLAGNLPRDRARLVAEVDQALAGARALRPDWARGL